MDFFDTLAASSLHIGVSTPASLRGSLLNVSRKTSWETPILGPSNSNDALDGLKTQRVLEYVGLGTNAGVSEASCDTESWNTLKNIDALGLSFTLDDSEAKADQSIRFPLDDIEHVAPQPLPMESQHPFNKWVKNIQKRATKRRNTISDDLHALTLDRGYIVSPRLQIRSRHMKSSSGSSAGFVTAVKSASVSMASFSAAPKSRRTGVSARLQRKGEYSRSSTAGRLSEDSVHTDRDNPLDRAVANRLLQRRRVIEEIISSEESYLGDAKFLMNVYVTLLASLPSLSPHLRGSINRNLNEIVELHEELLGDLYRVVPHSEYSQNVCVDAQPRLLPRSTGHHRWRSLDAVPEHRAGISWLQRIPGMTAEPIVAAKVAKVFEDKMKRFFVYEEYGAKYELMIKDIASAYRTIPQWEEYQKGLEALASSLASINCQNINPKKSLTIGDLLVKPIQRVCKYPLLLAELLKQTPVCDCPESHMQIENVLVRLREATTEINRATDDPRMKINIERSWLLQDRLVFADRYGSRYRTAIRALGHAILCGVLHVSWQKTGGVDGQYLICVMYRDFLLLASAAKAEPLYIIQACIALNDFGVEEVDNGRGLQCHTAPFSWKVVFEHDHQLFEITLSACSAKEELEWRSRLVRRSGEECVAAMDQGNFGSLSLDIKPLGSIFGKPGTIVRRISIQRATTVGPGSGLSHIIIRNTNASKDVTNSTSTNHINRSLSHLTTNRIPIIAASRAERIRLEGLLADVWTREVLPYPGMSGRARNEHMVRATASSMIRKLSVASIASNFTKRSGSVVSLHMTNEEDLCEEIDNAGSKDASNDSTGAYIDFEDIPRPRLAVIYDEKENARDESPDGTATTMTTPALSTATGAFRRLATLKSKKSWVAHDRQRIITPPLRTSSANSLGRAVHNRGVGAGPVMAVNERSGAIDEAGSFDDEDKRPRVSSARTLPTGMVPWETEGRRGKKEGSRGRSRMLVAEGIRNFFR